MKKYMFVVAATLGMMIGTGAFAQQPQQRNRKGAGERPTAEQMARQKSDRMKKQLALNDEQTQQLYNYHLQQFREMQTRHEAIMAEQAAKRAELEAARNVQREKMKALRQAEADRMKSILTPEQFDKWQQLRQQAPRGRRGQLQKGDQRRQQHGMKSGKRGRRGAGREGFKQGRKPHQHGRKGRENGRKGDRRRARQQGASQQAGSAQEA